MVAPKKKKNPCTIQRTPYIQELALKTASQPEPKCQTPNSSTVPSYHSECVCFLRSILQRHASHETAGGYRPLKRLFLSFSLQSSQYHLAVILVSAISKVRSGVKGLGSWGEKEIGAYHYSEARPSNRHTQDGTIPSHNHRHRIQPSLRN